MSDTKTDIAALIEGDLDDSPEVKEFYSHDASMFEMIPELVVAPKHSQDLQKIVKFVRF